MIFENFENILMDNINNKISEIIKLKTKHNGSLKELLFTNERYSKQSICIKIGNYLETAINKFVDEKYKPTKTLKDAINIIRDKQNYDIQIDLIFEKDGVIYYREVKSNTNLDTEKTKATYKKVTDIEKILKSMGYNVNSKVLSLRFCNQSDINGYIKKPFKGTDYFEGYGDFFRIFDINITEEDWTNIFDKIRNLIHETIN